MTTTIEEPMKPCPLCGGRIEPSRVQMGGGCDGGDEYSSDSFQCKHCLTQFLPYDWERVSGEEKRRIKTSRLELMNMRHATTQEDSLVAAIEGNFQGMAHSDLVLTCEMLTRGRAAWRKEAEKAAFELEALQKKVEQWNEKWKQAVEVNGNNCGELNRLTAERDALQKENAELKETISINQRAWEIGMRWQRNSALEEWFPITAEELTSLRTQNAELRELLLNARYLIAQIGTTGVERTDIIKLADKWLKALAAQPECKQVPVGTDAFYRSETGVKSVSQPEGKAEAEDQQ